ncbi:magnesium chelatase, partial [Patescibacteria group bacterium]
QVQRFAELKIITNSEMNSEQVKRFCQLSQECVALLRSAVSTMRLSARAYFRLIKIARTIADLAEAEKIAPSHIAEAIQYRFKAE